MKSKVGCSPSISLLGKDTREKKTDLIGVIVRRFLVRLFAFGLGSGQLPFHVFSGGRALLRQDFGQPVNLKTESHFF